MQKLYAKFIVIILLSLLIAGPSAWAAAPAGYREITDIGGIVVTIPQKVDRVVNLWNANSAGMICLGAGEKFAALPAGIKNQLWAQFIYPDIAKLPASQGNAEELLRLQPDVVVGVGDDSFIKLNEVGIPAVRLYFTDYESMKRSYSILGEILGPEYKAKTDRWCALIDENLARAAAAVGDIPEAEKPIVYHMQGMGQGDGLYSTFRADSIMNSWIKAGGGRSAAELLNLMSNNLSPEEILKLNPDVIIIGSASQHDIYDALMQSHEWREIKAVKTGRIYFNPIGVFPWDRFSCESALQILFAASVIHPDKFEVDMVHEIQNFYKEFAGVDLTEEHANNMLQGLGPDGQTARIVNVR